MIVVNVADHIVGSAPDPAVIAVPDHIFHAFIGGLGHGLEAFLVQHVVEIGVPNFGDQVAVNVKVLVDDHNVILDFLGSFFHLVLDGVHMVVVNVADHIVGSAPDPGVIAVPDHIFHAFMGGHGIGLEAFLVQHVVEIGVLDLGNQVVVGVKVLVDNHGVVLDFLDFLDVCNRLQIQRSTVRLANFAVGDLERNGVQSRIAVHLGLGQGVGEAGGDARDGHVAVGVRHAGQAGAGNREAGAGNREAGAGQRLAVLVHLLEAQRAQEALDFGNIEVQGLGRLRDIGAVVHLGEKVVVQRGGAVGVIRLACLKARARSVQGDGISQGVGVGRYLVRLQFGGNAVFQVPGEGIVGKCVLVVLAGRAVGRTAIVDELAHGVRDLPGLRAQLDELGDVLKLHGKIIDFPGGEALVGEGVHPAGNILPLTGPAAVYTVVPMIEIPTISVFRRLCLEIPEGCRPRIKRHRIKIDLISPNGSGKRLHVFPIFGISLVAAALNAFHRCGAGSGALVHMEGGAAVGQQNDVDVLAVLQNARLAAVDQIIRQLQAAFHVGAAGITQKRLFNRQLVDKLLKVRRSLRQIGPAAHGDSVVVKADQSGIALIGGLGALDVLVHKVHGRLFGRSQAIPAHTAGGVHYQDDRRIGGGRNLLEPLLGSDRQGDVELIFHTGFRHGLFYRHVIGLFRDRSSLGHDLGGMILVGGRRKRSAGKDAAREYRYAQNPRQCFSKHGGFSFHKPFSFSDCWPGRFPDSRSRFFTRTL